MSPAGRPSLSARFRTRNRALAREIEALARPGGNRTLAAKRLGVSRESLWKRERLHAPRKGSRRRRP